MAPGVNITTAVTGVTAERRRLLFDAAEMARLTGLFPVGAGQGKVCFFPVIKADVVPFALGMALIAILAVTTQVHIPDPMAANAFGVLECILFPGVTATALE